MKRKIDNTLHPSIIMKAAVLNRYGSPEGISIEEVEKPVPKENEVLIEIHAASLTAADVEMRILKFPWYFKIIMRLIMGIFRPRGQKILGQEVSGTIVQIGEKVKKFAVGDELFGSTGFSMRGHAEYITLPSNDSLVVLAKKPEGLSHVDACTIPLGGRHALFFVKKAGIKKGDEVLINGAGGTIGTYAIEIAKQMGGIVTAVDSGKKLEMMSSLGAEYVIDYREQDFAKLDKKYDIVFDILGTHSFNRGISVLKDDGYYVCSNPKISHIYKGWWVKLRSNKRIYSGILKEDVEDLVYLAQEIADGRLQAVIDRVIPLEEIVEGHAYVETGEKLGHVVISLKE